MHQTTLDKRTLRPKIIYAYLYAQLTDHLSSLSRRILYISTSDLRAPAVFLNPLENPHPLS